MLVKCVQSNCGHFKGILFTGLLIIFNIHIIHMIMMTTTIILVQMRRIAKKIEKCTHLLTKSDGISLQTKRNAKYSTK